MANEANTVSGAGEAVRTLGARTSQLRTDQPVPDQVERWYSCYGARGDLFTQESNQHPAKMAVQLAYRIFEHGRQRGYWKPGDTILDPMGGIGTTGIVGASLGYNVVLLELEHHFLSLAAANICVLRTKVGPPYFACEQCGFRVSRWNRSMDKPHLCQGCGLYDLPIEAGKISLLQGDARQLQAVLARADAALTSPPYAGEPHQGTDQHPERQEGGEWVSNAGAVISPVDAVVSSPPFLQASAGGGIADKGYGPEGSDKVGERTYSRKTAGTSPTQISNLPDPKGDIDAVLSSPPFENQNPGEKSTFMKEVTQRPNGKPFGQGKSLQHTYGNSTGQIGKQSGETYLSAMRQVYAQLHLVLRPGGVVCLVTKNPVKKGQIRRLDDDTIRLMESCGFTFLERQQGMLTEELGVQQRLDGGQTLIRRERKSFFKRLFERKYPDLHVDHEDVLWFRKA